MSTFVALPSSDRMPRAVYCRTCDALLDVDRSQVLLVNPPAYRAVCGRCGGSEWLDACAVWCARSRNYPDREQAEQLRRDDWREGE